MKITKKARKANYKRYLDACCVYLTAAGWAEVGPAKVGDHSLWRHPDVEDHGLAYTLYAAVQTQEKQDKAL